MLAATYLGYAEERRKLNCIYKIVSLSLVSERPGMYISTEPELFEIMRVSVVTHGIIKLAGQLIIQDAHPFSLMKIRP